MSEELKPVRCGCGGEAKVYHWNHDPDIEDWYGVRCSECHINISMDKNSGPFWSAKEAVEAWNRAMGERTAKGEWVDGLPYVNSHWWVCSVCHVPAPENHTGYNFCPNCGAEMTRGE